MERTEFFDKWSKLHGGAPIKGVVKGWLTLSYGAARFFSRVRVTPNILTSLGVVLAIFAWPTAHSWWAFPFILFSLFADGLDGSLAIYSGVDSTRGAMIDSFADRISEAFFLLLFYRLAPSCGVILFIAWSLTFTQEYIRARAQGLGNRATGVVSICERPVRVIILLLAIIGFHFNPHVASVAAYMWLVLQAIAISQVAVYQRKSI